MQIYNEYTCRSIDIRIPSTLCQIHTVLAQSYLCKVYIFLREYSTVGAFLTQFPTSSTVSYRVKVMNSNEELIASNYFSTEHQLQHWGSHGHADDDGQLLRVKQQSMYCTKKKQLNKIQHKQQQQSTMRQKMVLGAKLRSENGKNANYKWNQLGK